MKNNVFQLNGLSLGVKYPTNAVHEVDLPLMRQADLELENHLIATKLYSFSLDLLNAHPNLKATIDRLIHWLGIDWPSVENSKRSAVFLAIEEALLAVKEGLRRNETDYRSVVANFHAGLATLAPAIAIHHACGCKSDTGSNYEIWEPFSSPLTSWCKDGKFENLAFTLIHNPSRIYVYSILWKMRCTICNLQDIGHIHH